MRRCEKCGKEETSGENFREIHSETNCQDYVLCAACITLIKAERKRKEEEAKLAQEILSLGGPRAYKEFTRARYDRAEHLSKCAAYPQINLFLWGAAGVGKTHLGTALIREQNNYWIFKPQEISRMLRENLTDVEAEGKIYSDIISCPHLLIDDIGTEKKTDFLYSAMYEIIDGRYMQESGGLIITSNLSLDHLAARFGDDRLTSRIAGMCKIIEMTGKDRRLGQVVIDDSVMKNSRDMVRVYEKNKLEREKKEQERAKLTPEQLEAEQNRRNGVV